MQNPTNEQIREVWENYNPMHGIESFARAILEKFGQPIPDDWVEFVTRISKQKPEKPDYWSECGQCSRNIDIAEDLIANMEKKHG